MRKTFLIFALLIAQYSYTQSDLTVQLTVNGQGKSKDEAKKMLFEALMKIAFGM